MSIVLGIDLGTTNSCVAVHADADIPDKDRLVSERLLRSVGQALVITGADRSPTTPSVVWVGPDGGVEVGLRAKNKARVTGDGTTKPAMFFKRDMGTDQTVTAGHARLTPVEASAHILRHLKARAEEVLQVPIERAVITVPAFFEVNAKTATTEAGRLAGLEVVETLIEPVAAALAYGDLGQDADADGRTLLVYDLGGGTFDTSVVVFDPETGFENRSFHGDRYLGGYDFDRSIVGWLADRLPHYDLDLDPERPADARVLAQLLSTAEQTKHELTQFSETDIVNQHATDRSGEPMSIHEPIARNEFEELIAPAVKVTVDHCDQALEQAGVAATDLDEIVMVGGSARIPLVGQMLSERFGRPARLLNPDLCVAVGAALKAATATRRSRFLELDHPEPTTPTTDVGGRVLATEPITEPARAKVVLSSDDGLLRMSERPAPDGDFLFVDVPVREGDDNGFTVTVSVDGQELDTQYVRVAVAGAPASAPAGDVLAHDFSVELVDGPHKVVDVGTVLPYRTEFRLETVGSGDRLHVRLFEGMVPVGEVIVQDLPADLPVGTAVDVTLDFELGWTIQARARVPDADAEGRAELRIPRRQVSSWAELARETDELRASWEERRTVMAPADALRVGARLDRHVEEVEDLVDERQDRTKAHHKLVEAQTLLRGVSVAGPAVTRLEPPLSEFEELCQVCAADIELLAQHDATEARRHSDALEGIRASGRAAYEAGEQLDWYRAVESVRTRIGMVRRRLPETAQPQISAEDLKAVLVLEVRQIADTVTQADADTQGRHRAEAEEHIRQVQPILDELAAVSPGVGEEEAKSRLAAVYRSRIEPFRRRVSSWLDRLRGGGHGDSLGLTLPKSSMGGR